MKEQVNEEILEVMLTRFVKSRDRDESTRSKEDVKVQNAPATKQVHISF